MHIKASNSFINMTEQMKLEVVLAEGADKFQPDTADELFIHLMQVHRCSASGDPLQVVAIDTGFNANRNTGGDRQPILRLIGLCYTDGSGYETMFSVNMKVVDGMNKRDMN